MLTLITIYWLQRSAPDRKNYKVPEAKTKWDLGKLYAQRQEVQDNLEEKLCAIESESGNVEVQWNNTKKCVLDTVSDLVGKVVRRARKSWITQEMISKMDELKTSFYIALLLITFFKSFATTFLVLS
jgi:hypothetical protein